MDKERDRKESCQGKEAGQTCWGRKKTWLGCREETAGLSRMIRSSLHPVKTNANLIVDDRLEQEGCIRLFEYTGGALYPPSVLSGQPNAVLVAAAEITRKETGGIKVKRLFCEFGYDSLACLIVDQLLHFADFHGYGDVEFLDLRKNNRKSVMA